MYPPFLMHFQFLGLFRKVRSGFHLHLISNLQKNNTDHFLLKSFLESIDIDIFLSETDVGQKVPEKVEKRQNINGVPIVTQAENTSRIPKNMREHRKIRKQSYQ